MKLSFEPDGNIPDDAECPLSDDFLRDYFQKVLPEAVLLVSKEWFQRTSDVLIARSNFGAVDKNHRWRLRQVAIDRTQVERVRELLVPNGVSELLRWFKKSSALVNEDQTLWICCSLTVRYENGSLIFDESTSVRPDNRPEPGWPKESYTPSSKDEKY
jgi:hypothetical protein